LTRIKKPCRKADAGIFLSFLSEPLVGHEQPGAETEC
jgi:hypothetical protein